MKNWQYSFTAKLWWEGRPKYTSIKSASVASGRPIILAHLRDDIFVYRTSFSEGGCVNTSVGSINLSTGAVTATYKTFTASCVAKIDDNSIITRWYDTYKDGSVSDCGTYLVYYDGSSWVGKSVDSELTTIIGKSITTYHNYHSSIFFESIENNRVSFMYNTSGNYNRYPSSSVVLYRSGSNLLKDESALPMMFSVSRESTHYGSMYSRPGGAVSIHPEDPENMILACSSGAGSDSSTHGSYLVFSNRSTSGGSTALMSSSSSSSYNELYSTGCAWIDKTHAICGFINRGWPYSADYGCYSVYDLASAIEYAKTSGASGPNLTKCGGGNYSNATNKLTWPAAHLIIADLGNYNALGIWDNGIGLVNITDYSNVSFDTVFPNSCRKTISGLNPAAVSCVVQTSTGFVISLYNGYWITITPS